MNKILIGSFLLLAAWFIFNTSPEETQIEVTDAQEDLRESRLKTIEEVLEKSLQSKTEVSNFVDKMTDKKTGLLSITSVHSMKTEWILLDRTVREEKLLDRAFYDYIEKPWSLTLYKDCDSGEESISFMDADDDNKRVTDEMELEMRVNKDPMVKIKATHVISGSYSLYNEEASLMIEQLKKNGSAIFRGREGTSPTFDLAKFTYNYNQLCK